LSLSLSNPIFCILANRSAKFDTVNFSDLSKKIGMEDLKIRWQ
jgi:hypothetical protein